MKNTVPVLADAMESLRGNMIVFRYQLRRIGAVKQKLSKYVGAVKPEMERYAGLVWQIKGKDKERKTLLAEKRETPVFNILRQRDLSRRIAELTEDLEELKSEKAALLNTLDCVDDAAISAVKKEIVTMEGLLHKMSEQGVKYSAELADALKQYAELKEQAANMEAAELVDARLAIRDEKEHSAVDCVKAAYGEKYDSLMMRGSMCDVANLLHEEAEAWSVREFLYQQKKPYSQQQRKSKRHEQER